MILLLILFPLLAPSIFSQSDSIDLHSPENIKLFADHLFCEGDYLRAAEEYESIQTETNNDTIDFKIMLCYSEIGQYKKSNNVFHRITGNSTFRINALHLSLKNRFVETEKGLHFFYDTPPGSGSMADVKKLKFISFLFDKEIYLTKEEFLLPFDKKDKVQVSSFYDFKSNPPYKSEVLAGIFSTLIPGSGKMYADEWGDGITAFLVTGLFAFLAVDNFNSDHNTRGWIFTGLGAFFYAGNIYGSIAAAQIYNARIAFEFKDGIKLFLEQKNYFMPEYNFCE